LRVGERKHTPPSQSLDRVSRLQAGLGGRRVRRNGADQVAALRVKRDANILRKRIDPNALALPGAGVFLFLATNFFGLVAVNAAVADDLARGRQVFRKER